MKVDVSFKPSEASWDMIAHTEQDPAVQKATGETDPVEVMAKLREMKNNM